MTNGINRRDFIKLGGAAASMLLASSAGRLLGQTDTLYSAPKPASGLPNVILIIMDTVRAKSLSLYGYQRQTSPQLEKLSRQGVLFQAAIAASPWTLPSHASIMTGQWPNKLSTGWYDPLDDSYAVIAEAMRANGYRTAGFIANHIYCSREFGLDRGFKHYEDYRLTLGQMALKEALTHKLLSESKIYEAFAANDNFGRKSAEHVNHEFLRWLSRHSAEQPFFAFLNYFDAHDPFLPPDEFWRLYSSEKPFGHLTDEIWKTHPPDIIRQLKDAYDSAITYLDFQVGWLFDRLGEMGALDNTLVIISSDHGEQFGEHGLLGHGNSQFLELIHVPLILIFPGRIPAGEIVQVPVSLRNIPATILDLAGLPNRESFPGKSLARFWSGDNEAEKLYSHLYINTGAYSQSRYDGFVESLYYRGLHYIKASGGIQELYDIGIDPQELNDLSNDPAYQLTLAHYLEDLKAVRSAP